MNSILMGNFPRMAEEATFTNCHDSKDVMRVAYGYECYEELKVQRRRNLVSQILSSILIHDKIILDFSSMVYLVSLFNQEELLLLLHNDLFGFIHDYDLRPMVRLGRENELIFFHAGDEGNYIEGVESRLARIYNKNDPSYINKLMLLLDKLTIKNLDADKTVEKIKNELAYDLNNRNVCDFLNIKSNNCTNIYDSDIYQILRISVINHVLVQASEIGVNNILLDAKANEFLGCKTSLVTSKYINKSANIFDKILIDKQIPQLIDLYDSDVLTVADVIQLRNNINGVKFRDWYYDSSYDYREVYKTIMSSGKDSNLIRKTLRWLIPNAIGAWNMPAGLVASFTDSFLLNKFIGGWHPNLFLDDVLRQSIDKKSFEQQKKARLDQIRARFGNVSRKDPCPCGSGKRFKRCCGF